VAERLGPAAEAAADFNRLVEDDLRAAYAQARWLEEALRAAASTMDGEPTRT
jgi:hypothetical protein